VIAATKIKKEIVLAAIIMKSPRWSPYKVQRITPKLNWNNVIMLTSFADFVLIILSICGTKPKVVSRAAAIPIMYHSMN